MGRYEHFDGIRFGGRPAVSDLSRRARPHLGLVDSSRLRRDCLRLALAQAPGGWRITETGSATELADGGEQDFDVVLLGASSCNEIDLADVSQLAGLAPVLVCADCDDAQRARQIIDAGARGFSPANRGLRVLLAALERVRAGGSYVPPLPLAAEPSAMAEGACRGLTRRQREVLALISEGKSNKLIAEALTMSEDTVKAHVKQIIRRLNVSNRTQAALLAARASGRYAPARARA